MSGKTEKAIVGVVVGAAIGAALYYAFKEKSTKDKFKDGFNHTKHDLADAFEEMTRKVKSKFGSSKKSFESSFDDLVANGKHTKEDVVGILENKLKELKHNVHVATK
ncbi:MAG: hypothetical protein PSV16_01305 [Flavobacterium sp.]|nr:hypothetical protein [Flavobacterium sp.]